MTVAEQVQSTSNKIPVGPWSGIDNINPVKSRTFQPSESAGAPLPALSSALNVDLDNDGWPRSRQPTVRDAVVVEGLGAWTVAGRMFFQDASTLYERTESGDVAIVYTASRRVKLAEHWGNVYITDGTNHWELRQPVVAAIDEMEPELRPWGLPVPTLSSVTQTTGTLYAPGKYMVSAAFVDAYGNEGGLSPASAITLTAGAGSESAPYNDGGISVAVGGSTDAVAGVNIYVTEPNQKIASFAALTSAPIPATVAITAITSVGDPPRTAYMQGPISDADGLFSFRGFLLMWRDGIVFRSESAEPHLFSPINIMQFPSNVVAAEGVSGGMWIATEKGLWWVFGEAPEKWIPVRKTTSTVYAGSMTLPGAHIPLLQTDDMVALFVTSEGMVAGKSDGTVVFLTKNKYVFPAGTRASFCYAERDDLRQILVAVTGS